MNEITIPPLIPAATAGNLTNLIAERAWFEPNRIIMSRPVGEGWAQVTAREVETEVREVAKGLIAAGIQFGDRVGLMSRTRYEWTILDFAIWYAGAITVPIYETSSAEQIDWILNDSGAVGLIVETPANRELAQSVLPGHTKHVWTITEDALGILRNTGKHIGDEEIERRRSALKPEHLATLIYTSGTTGKPKGVVHTTAGYMVWANYTFVNVFQYQRGQIHFCTADIGWIAAPGPLHRSAADPGRFARRPLPVRSCRKRPRSEAKSNAVLAAQPNAPRPETPPGAQAIAAAIASTSARALLRASRLCRWPKCSLGAPSGRLSG